MILYTVAPRVNRTKNVAVNFEQQPACPPRANSHDAAVRYPTKPMTSYSSRPACRALLVAAVVLLAGVTSSLTGQVAPTTAATPTRAAPASSAKSAEAETVTLSPFVVSTELEDGWSANETLSATRTKQALKDVPINIDAITRDFMEDLGLFTVDDIANYVAGAWAPSTLENDNQSGAIAFRGLSGSTASRNYFRWYIPSDNYNVERVDFGKGSNSLIFGDVEPGGQASIFTKRALMKNFGEFYGYYNHYGAYRFQVDYNRKVLDNLAFRFNAVKRQERTYQDASTFGLDGQTLTTSWRAFRNTNVRLEYERGDFANVRGFGGLTIRERSGRSRAFTNDRLYYTSDGESTSSATLSRPPTARMPQTAVRPR
jgi:outer membrane receptor protein involved in Fe transport